MVRLEDISTTILTQHTYPLPVAKILADLLAASATLAGILKYKGVFTIQTKTSGPLSLIIIDVTNEGHMRGYAQFKPQAIKQEDNFNDLLGHGHLAFTINQPSKNEQYQGIVTLNQQALSDALEHYFEQSEQLETRFYITSEKTKEGKWRSGAILLQQMPSKTVSQETWTHMEAILNTLTPSEFLDFSIPYHTLLYRLFHEGSLTVFEPFSLKAQCRCSKKRIQRFLTTLSLEEIESLLEKGRLKITCEFCNHHYEFERHELMKVH